MRQTRINPRDAAQGNFLLQKLLEANGERLNQLELKVGASSFDSENKTPLAATPKPASIAFSATSGSGRFVIRVTNPEYVGRGNTRKTPILHHIQFSPSPTFSKGIVEFPISTQTYYHVPVEDVGGTPGTPMEGYFRIRSSRDGQNFNNFQQSAKLTA